MTNNPDGPLPPPKRESDGASLFYKPKEKIGVVEETINAALEREAAQKQALDAHARRNGHVRDPMPRMATDDPQRDMLDVRGEYKIDVSGREPPHNAEEAKADDRQLLASLRKIDDLDAKLWRLQQRVAAGESERQALSSEISGLRASLARNTKGDNMVRNMLILIGCLAVLGLVGLTVWAALS